MLVLEAIAIITKTIVLKHQFLSRHNMSDVWKFFKKDGNYSDSCSTDAVRCTLCGKRNKQLNGSTTNMRTHLMKAHPREYYGATRKSISTVVATSTKSKLEKYKHAEESSTDTGDYKF